MSKRKLSTVCDTARPNKKARDTFKLDWLQIKVTTDTPDSKNVNVDLGSIYEYSEENGLKCNICAACSGTKGNKDNEYVTGKRWDSWKLDYCKRHLTSRIHTENVQILYTRKHGISLKRLLEETSAEREARFEQNERLRSSEDQIRILMDNVLLAIDMNASMRSVLKLHDHVGKYVSLPDSWRSKNYAFEFVAAINEVVADAILTELRASSFHTLIVDESTDIAVHKILILYFKYRAANSLLYKTVFGGIVQLTECNAPALETAIRRFYNDHQINIHRLVMITSDGASVMLGKRNGLVALMKRNVPHLSEQHCVAHREDLALTDSWKDNSLMKSIEVLLRTVYTLFSRSSVKTSELSELSNVHDVKVISFRPIHEVRWLSHHFAVSAFVRNLDALVLYCEEQVNECMDPVCTYVLRLIQDPLYLIALYTVNDVLADLANLSQLLQRSNLSPIEAHQFCVSKIRKLEAQYLTDNVFWNDKVKQILSENKDIDTRQITRFIRSVCDHLKARYPADELKFWSAFDPTALKSCTFDFGVTEVKELCAKYKDLLGITNDDLITQQYNDFKFLMSEKLKSGTIISLPDIAAISLNDGQFNLLSMLIDICCTFQASSADCERGFSLMNSIKVKSRNKLDAPHLDQLMRIKLYLNAGGIIDLHKAFTVWKDGKVRREKF